MAKHVILKRHNKVIVTCMSKVQVTYGSSSGCLEVAAEVCFLPHLVSYASTV